MDNVSVSMLPDLMNDWEIGGTQNKWVCPSDRHLQLRAQSVYGIAFTKVTYDCQKIEKVTAL